MSDGNKIAAAILAAEAFRQHRASEPGKKMAGPEIEAALMSCYEHFVNIIPKDKG